MTTSAYDVWAYQLLSKHLRWEGVTPLGGEDGLGSSPAFVTPDTLGACHGLTGKGKKVLFLRSYLGWLAL
jgi:hypothetical protein